MHILRAHYGREYRFYELTGDLPEALHFRHFTGGAAPLERPGRIRLGGEVHLAEANDHRARGRVVLRET